MAAVPRGGHAVEQVHPAGDSLEQIRWKANTHKITGRVARQVRRERLQDAVHHRLGLSDREAPDGDSGPRPLRERALQRSAPKVVMGAALEDGPEGLGADRAIRRTGDRLPPGISDRRFVGSSYRPFALSSYRRFLSSRPFALSSYRPFPSSR